MKKKSKLIAFWKYDLYPYLLWGEIDTKFPPKLWKNKLTYYIPSYQSYMAPVFIMEGEDGEIMGNYLYRLKQDKCNAIQKINDEYKNHLKRVLSENEIDYDPTL